MAFATCTTCGILAALSCGGTTGREGLTSEDPGATDTGLVDATVSDDPDADAGTFDVQIVYATRELPDVAVRPDAGGEAGYPWPSCPPFVPVTGGIPQDPTLGIDQIPASFDSAGNVLLDDAGRVVPAPEGGACASYGWLGSVQSDQCTTQAGAGTTAFVFFPPCNWCADAGVAGAGSGAGAPLYDLCLQYYECIQRTACFQQAPDGKQEITACLCGDSPTTSCTGTGPCGPEALAAMQTPNDPKSILAALTNFISSAPSGDMGAFFCGSALNDVFQIALTGLNNKSCIAQDAGPF